MAKKSKNQNNSITAGDLRSKMSASKKRKESLPDERFDEIDLTNDTANSDSELDISSLLKKYMPEYADDPEGEDAEHGSVLSRLKKSAEIEKSNDEKLMNALDSAFSMPETQEDLISEYEFLENSYDAINSGGEEAWYDEYDETSDMPTDDIVWDEAPAEEYAEQYDEQYTEEYAEQYDEQYAEEYAEQYDEQYADGQYYESDNTQITDELFYEEEPKKLGLFGKLKAMKAARAQKKLEKQQAEAEAWQWSADDRQYYGDEQYTDGQYDDGQYDDGQYAEQYAEEYTEQYNEEQYTEEQYAGEQYAEQYDEQYTEEQYADEQYTEQYAEENTEQYAEETYSENVADELFGGEIFDEAELRKIIPETADETAAAQEVSDAEYAENVPEAYPEDMVLTMTGEENVPSSYDTLTPEDVSGIIDDEFDPTDINLMVAFGLDSGEDDRSDRAKEFGDKLMERQKQRGTRKFKLDRPEFVDKSQIPQIRGEYKKKTSALWIKLAICGVMCLLLLFFENIASISSLFTGERQQFAGVFDPAVYPTVYSMVSLQIMLIACLCAFDQIVHGVKYLFKGMPKPETITALLAVLGIVYSAVVSQVVESPEEPVMFNFVVALAAFLTLIYAIFNNKREMMNFRVVANKRPKHIVRRLVGEESENEAQAFSEAEDICDVMKIEKTDFIDGFFSRLGRPDPATGTFITFLMSVSAALAALLGIFAAFKGSTAGEVCAVVFASLLVLTPLSVFITFSYPFYRANRAAKEYDSAIIGETSLDEYSNASIISFDDKNVFPSYAVKVQNIRIYNNARIDRVLYYASSVFAYAGGPLQDVFEVATKDMGNSQNVQIFDTEDGFLATQVDGVNIIFGSCEALTARGLEIPASAAEDDVDLSSELEIMYMFRESKLVAKMYIKYVMDADIDLILKQFSGNGLYVCVRTFDPNINEHMIAKKLNLRRIPLKIIRYADADEVGYYEEKVDSGLVTCGSPKSLLQIISYCGKVLHTKKTNIALSTLSIMIGIAILALLLFSGSISVVSSLFVALYQLVWVIPMMISSRMFIR
ncbi:MAG: hypothetical protein E7628_06345 [Ruminococcaceae bacterium]|nr:hypothetical protein [Oscillospiraceae bacterium]